MGMQTYICGTLPFTALQVNPTMTTSTAEKPRNLKKVHLNFWGGFLGFRLSFNQNIKHYFLYLRGIRYTFSLCVNISMTVECLIWLLVMYFAPKHMIRLSVDYRQESKIPIRLRKSLVGDTPLN